MAFIQLAESDIPKKPSYEELELEILNQSQEIDYLHSVIAELNMKYEKLLNTVIEVHV